MRNILDVGKCTQLCTCPAVQKQTMYATSCLYHETSPVVCQCAACCSWIYIILLLGNNLPDDQLYVSVMNIMFTYPYAVLWDIRNKPGFVLCQAFHVLTTQMMYNRWQITVCITCLLRMTKPIRPCFSYLSPSTLHMEGAPFF